MFVLQKPSETILYVYIDCEIAKCVWNQLSNIILLNFLEFSLVHFFPYSDRMRESTDQTKNKNGFGYFTQTGT